MAQPCKACDRYVLDSGLTAQGYCPACDDEIREAMDEVYNAIEYVEEIKPQDGDSYDDTRDMPCPLCYDDEGGES